MFPVSKFSKHNNKTYLFKVKINNQILEFWKTGFGLYIASNEYKKDRPLAMDFDSFIDDALYLRNDNPISEMIKATQRMISMRLDVELESSSIENAVKLFSKQR